ncbi:MAG: hypothetical protein V1747_10750 [Candidatus Omnitrophota bacterium]
MRRARLKVISISIIHVLFITFCLPSGNCENMRAENYTQSAAACTNMLSPRLLIQNDILLKGLGQQSSALLLLPEIEKITPPSGQTWLQQHFPTFHALFNKRPLMTVSMEGFHEKYSTQALNANSKGGLGAFFGCLIRGLKKIGVKTIAFQPDFSKRRRQTIRLKHDYVVDHVKSVLSNLHSRNFQDSAYPVTELILRLSEKNMLSKKNFEQAVMKDLGLKNGIYANALEPDGKEADIGKENIAYVYTAALSVLIDHATHGNKIEVAERAVSKIYKTMHANGAINGKIVNHTLVILQSLSREKQITLEHFQLAIKNDTFLDDFLTKSGVKYEILYSALLNYLARTAVTKEQIIVEEPVSYDNEPGEYFRDERGNEFVVTVGGLDVNDPAKTQYYDVKFKRYFDGNVTRIQMVCPELYGLLYKSDVFPSGKRQRFNEYMVSSWAMYAFLKHFPKFNPGIVHFNESPFILLAALMQADSQFKTIPSIYTNHTVVQAGLPTYDGSTASMERMFEIMSGGYMIKGDKVSFSIKGDLGEKTIEKMRETFTHNGRIDLSNAAVNLADAPNGVSPEHALVTKALFRTAKKIIGVLNGSSDYWKNEALISLEEQKGKENITAEELGNIHQTNGKDQLIRDIEQRTGVLLNKNKQIVSLIRRISNYKSQFPILKDIVRVICADRGTKVRTRWGDLEGLGQQVIVGGFAYSGSEESKWIEAFLGWMNDPDLKDRFVFVPDSDVELLKLQAIGSDICINCPLPFEEACGTSDQRDAENGGLNVVIYESGGGKEYLSQVDRKKRTGSGWMIGVPEQPGKPMYENAWAFYDHAPKAIYDALSEASDIYYNDPLLWQQLMLNAYRASEKVTAEAMAMRYVKDTFGFAVDAAQIRTAMIMLKDAELESFLSDKRISLTPIEQSI